MVTPYMDLFTVTARSSSEPSTKVIDRPSVMNDYLGRNPAALSVDSLDEDIDISWEKISTIQNELFKRVSRKIAMVEQQLAKCEQELSVWKLAFDNSERQRKELEKKLAVAESAQHVIQHDNPLVVCLIDGDGAFFSEELLALGREGGEEAAVRLMDVLHQHIEEDNQEPVSETASQMSSSYVPSFSFGGAQSPRFFHPPQIMTTIHTNFAGHISTLTKSSPYAAQKFIDFVIGFNQAIPLFTIVDAGPGKQGAYAKLSDSVRVHVRSSQSNKIFLGGVHNNAYIPLLSSLRKEGLLHKVVVYKDSAKSAPELDRLIRESSLKALEIPGLMVSGRLEGSLGAGATPQNDDDFESQRSISSLTQASGSYNHSRARENKEKDKLLKPQVSENPSPVASQTSSQSQAPDDPNPANPSTSIFPLINPKRPLTRQDPLLCDAFYLARCVFPSCRYSHDYRLDNEQLTRLRTEASKLPCTFLLKGQHCLYFSRLGGCIYAHNCPNGPNCLDLKNNRCRFATAYSVYMHYPVPMSGSMTKTDPARIFSF